MTFASGIIPPYEEVSDVIEALVYSEGKRYPIPGLDFEDVAQEIRLECVRVLQYYDSDRIGPSPYKFLQTCIRNFLYNKRRGIWVPNNPPCVRCPLWNKENKTCMVNEVDCDKIVQYRKNMSTKASLRQPNSLEFEILDEDYTEVTLLDQSIRNVLPEHLVEYYVKMISGDKIPARIKKQIRDIVSEIIE